MSKPDATIEPRIMVEDLQTWIDDPNHLPDKDRLFWGSVIGALVLAGPDCYLLQGGDSKKAIVEAGAVYGNAGEGTLVLAQTHHIIRSDAPNASWSSIRVVVVDQQEKVIGKMGLHVMHAGRWWHADPRWAAGDRANPDNPKSRYAQELAAILGGNAGFYNLTGGPLMSEQSENDLRDKTLAVVATDGAAPNADLTAKFTSPAGLEKRQPRLRPVAAHSAQ